ncbi:PTS lactose/cellobiose transporter subunit IIA [Breznakia sp. OttesenSCG-928-G09]|nr:PTS lactose/cellobiose transporter subunit IIA [Breznakia sp. OttesenSCG-928-G09]
MKDLELISFQIISAVGSARSLYIEAIQEAKNKNFKRAKSLVEEGSSQFIEGHRAHTKLIQEEANINDISINLLLVHAEDQLMSADTFKIIAEEFIEIYEKLDYKEIL